MRGINLEKRQQKDMLAEVFFKQQLVLEII